MTNSKRKPTSIWPGPALESYLDQLGPRSRQEGVSRMIERALSRYRHVLISCLPEWSQAEWGAAIEILKDHDMTSVGGIRAVGLVLAAGAEQPRSVPGAVASLSTNFIYKARRMDGGTRVAVAEVVEGYWRRHDVLDPARLTAWLSDCGVTDLGSTTPVAGTVVDPI